MKKMKKIITMSFLCLTIGLTVSMGSCGKHSHQYIETVVPPTCTTKGYTEYKCECGDLYTENSTDIIAHNGTGTCSMCKLDYYEELKQLVILNGVQGNNSMYYYAGETSRQENIELSTYVCFDPSTFNISVGVNCVSKDGSYTMTNDFMFFIMHPSESSGIKTGKCDWMLRIKFNTLESLESGTINGSTFSSMTTSLSMTSGYDSTIAELAATFAKNAIEGALIPLLKTSKNNVTPSNYGFINYSL